VTAKSVTDGSRDGALIESISPGGAASKAGLQEGDVITKVDDVAITGSDHLIVTVRAHQVGDVVALSYVRGGTTHRVSAALQAD
jgi:putative serine protease PepD